METWGYEPRQPLTDMIKLPSKDLRWFHLANAKPQAGWYKFKDRFLKRFATPAGWDFQTIEHHCWNCGGSGFFALGGECQGCEGSGVHRTTHHWLERWDLQGRIYHRPVSCFEAPSPRPNPVQEIEGRIKHDASITEAQARRAFARLLLRYEPMNWWRAVVADVRAKFTLGWRWKFRLMKLRNKLDLFPAISPSKDEVPF